MVQITKTIVFLCMLIGCSQAFPQHGVVSENEAMKDADIKRERQADILNVSTTVCCKCTANNFSCYSFTSLS